MSVIEAGPRPDTEDQPKAEIVKQSDELPDLKRRIHEINIQMMQINDQIDAQTGIDDGGGMFASPNEELTAPRSPEELVSRYRELKRERARLEELLEQTS